MPLTLVCIPTAIGADERPRYNELIRRLAAAVRERTELADGFAFALDTSITLPEVAEWIAMERLCCPFLTFLLDVSPGGATQLTLSGPEGVKAILRHAITAASD
jgi:hypothetical protein